MSEISNDITIEELAKRVDCLNKNISRILGYLAKNEKDKEDQKRRRRERTWA
jgi:hypothetical protein